MPFYYRWPGKLMRANVAGEAHDSSSACMREELVIVFQVDLALEAKFLQVIMKTVPGLNSIILSLTA